VTLANALLETGDATNVAACAACTTAAASIRPFASISTRLCRAQASEGEPYASKREALKFLSARRRWYFTRPASRPAALAVTCGRPHAERQRLAAGPLAAARVMCETWPASCI